MHSCNPPTEDPENAQHPLLTHAYQSHPLYAGIGPTRKAPGPLRHPETVDAGTQCGQGDEGTETQYG